MVESSYRVTRRLPDPLLEEVRAGRCVAFVGAGFSQPAVPGWSDLLRALAGHLPDTSQAHVQALLSPNPSALDLEAAAQMIRGGLTGKAFKRALRAVLSQRDDAHHAGVERRVAWLQAIPFAAVLTTNFDRFLPGTGPSPKVYRGILRHAPQTPIRRLTVKLHGDLGQSDNPVVLSREDYRARLYQDGRYANFLRTLFATRTALFLGVSFTDAYLNELRSEVLALLGRSHRRPLAYAILPDCTKARARYFRAHEGIKVIGYRSDEPAHHGGFDRLLETLHAQTRPFPTLAALLQGKRILWLDPHPEHNAYAREVLAGDRRATPDRRLFHAVGSVEEALNTPLERYHLAITHYGWTPVGDPTAVRFLKGLRERQEGPPVIVFASPQDAATRRREVQRLGALDYCHQWEDLFFVLQTFFRTRVDEG